MEASVETVSDRSNVSAWKDGRVIVAKRKWKRVHCKNHVRTMQIALTCLRIISAYVRAELTESNVKLLRNVALAIHACMVASVAISGLD